MTSRARAWRPAIAVLLGALVSGIAVQAQSVSGALSGRVLDAASHPVAAAVVQVRHEDTGAVRSAISGDDGAWRLEGLDPGSWTVVARGPDGTASASRSVVVALQREVRVELVLGAGLTESVEVRADAPLVDPQQVGGRLRILGEQTDALPVVGRDATSLALLDASVRTAEPGNFFGERGSPFILNGQSGRSNAFLVDGLDNNDQTSGTSVNAFFSQQVIREFVVLTSQYAPEFGRATGGVLNIVTRQGTNEFEGDAFVQGTSDGWNRSGPLVDALPDRGGPETPTRLQTGFRLGGPFKKDRAFYFLAYELQTADEIALWSGIDRDGIAGGRVVAPNRSDNLFFRTDFNLSERHDLMVRLSVDDRETRQVNVGGRFTPEAGFGLDESDVQLAATWTTYVSANLLNEVRFLVGTSSFLQRANSERPGAERPSGIFGGNNLSYQDRDEERVQLVENLTWVSGDHTFKFGVDVTRSRTAVDTRFNPTGNFLYTTDDPFDPGDCLDLIASQVDPENPKAPIPCSGDGNGNGIPDEPGFIYTYPLVYQFIFGEPSIRLDDTRFGVFAQDSWRPSEAWRFDYGFRYDVGSYRLPASARVDSAIPNGGADRDTDDIAPRLGFTWTPGGRGATVIRGGAGVFHDKLVLAFPAVAAVTSGTEIGLLFPQGLTFELTEEVVEQFIDQFGYDAFRDVVENDLVFPEDLTLRFSTATELETPYTVQYNLGLEQRLGRRSAIRANVVRTLGYHLPRMRDLNPVTSLSPPCRDDDGNVVPGDLSCVGIPVHRDPDVGSIAAITTTGRSWYSALETGYRWRGERSWASLSYTWSKALDTGPDPLKGGIYLPPDSDDLRSEKGRSDHDRRHRVVLSGEGPLPWWNLRGSIVAQYMSGAPFNVTTGLDENVDGINSDRPEGVGRNSGESTSLDAVNVIRAEEGLPPVEGLAEPSLLQVDVRLTWPFALRGGDNTGELFLQVFNLFDRFNGGAVEGRVTSRDFGRAVAQVGPPRTLEVGLRLGF